MSSSSSSVSSSSSPRGFQAARERLNLQKQHDREGNGGMDVFLKRTDAGRYLSSLFFEKDDNTKWILNVAGVLFLCVMCVFVLAGFEHVFRGGGGGVVVEAKPPVLSEREEEKEEEVKEEEKTTTKTLSVESIQNMTEDELRVLELSVKMRDVLSKEKSNALREARLSVERKQLEAKLAGLDLKKESNETMKTTNDMKRESLEFKMKLNREKVFREDVADALRTGLVVVCGALVYFGWNVIRDAWLNESEICYSASYAAASFSLVPSNLGVLFSAFTNRLEKLWCVSKTFAKALFTSIASLYCSKLVVKFGLLSSTNSTVSPLSSIALTVGVGGGYLGYKFVRYLRGDETKFLYLWSFYVLSVFAANESADYIGREVLQSTLRRILFRVTLGLAFPLIIASGSFR